MAGQLCDLLIEDGKIARLGNFLDAGGGPVEDAGGAIAIPGLVESHTHPDKTLWGMSWYTYRTGGVPQDLIENERNERIPLGLMFTVNRCVTRSSWIEQNGTSHDQAMRRCRHRSRVAASGASGYARKREALRVSLTFRSLPFLNPE